MSGQPTGDSSSHSRGLAGRRGGAQCLPKGQGQCSFYLSGLRAAGTRHCGCTQFSLKSFEKPPSTSVSGKLLNLECAAVFLPEPALENYSQDTN